MSQLDLHVPFEQKDRARDLGARWDAQRGVWYVPYGRDINVFRQWWPRALAKRMKGLEKQLQRMKS